LRIGLKSSEVDWAIRWKAGDNARSGATRLTPHPQTNPKYQFFNALYSSLALFETTNRVLQLVENTLIASLITQRSLVQIQPPQPIEDAPRPSLEPNAPREGHFHLYPADSTYHQRGDATPAFVLDRVHCDCHQVPLAANMKDQWTAVRGARRWSGDFGLGETAGSAGRAFSFEWDLVVLAVSSKALSHRISLLTGSLTGKF